MATVANRLSTVSPAPLPANEVPIASTDRVPGRHRVAAAAIAGYAFYLWLEDLAQ